MKYVLKTFQENATCKLLGDMQSACDLYYRNGRTTSCCLSAPTGAGKTVMAAAAIEALFYGNVEWNIERDEKATILWVTDSPSLNEQTLMKFKAATDLDPSLIVTIENTFTQENMRLKPGHIYFLNRQKLSSSGKLVQGGETLTFWNLLKDTIADPSVHLFMILDEAHKGLGSAEASETDGDTIYAKIIDGEDKNTPIPVVVGISATPKRFNRAMERRTERTKMPVVVVKPSDVQSSGLLKEKIILDAPAEGAAVAGLYLTAACQALTESTKLWAAWCKHNDENTVFPLMVVQVPDKVSDNKIQELSSEICIRMPELDRTTAFAHVFGEHSNIHLNGFEIPYIEPQDVQRKSDVRILFAKEAISTGWDCPRAEVIYSERPHKDDTYIAQLIGRMVRTPLARTVDVPTLNTVRCHLPLFDPQTLKKVVKYLTEEDSDDFSGVSESSGREIILDRVDVEWDSSLGVDEAFSSIGSRTRPHEKSNWIEGILSYTGMLSEYGVDDDVKEVTFDREKTETVQIDTDESTNNEVQSGVTATVEIQNIRENTPTKTEEIEDGEEKPDREELVLAAMLRELNDSILTYYKEFEVAKRNVEHVKSTKVSLKYMDADSVTENTYTEDADAYAVRHARRSADGKLSASLTNMYFRQETARGKTPIEINIEIAAAAAVPEIVDAVTRYARKELESLTEQYDKKLTQYPDKVRSEFSSKLYKHGIVHTVYLSKPAQDVQDGRYKAYPKHVVSNPETHMAYLNLSTTEDAVVFTELRRPNVLAWYRNPQGRGDEHTLSIQYRIGDARPVMHPDFIFFDKVEGQGEMPAIVDPHGLHLADALDKLKGMATHVEYCGADYSRIWCVSDYKGKAMYLDMKDDNTREYVKSALRADDCFDRFGKVYRDKPLSAK